jgi:hypothetical protein
MAKRLQKPALAHQIVVRIEPRLRRAIAQAAEQDSRPLASMVRIAIAEWLASRSHDARTAA